ncbi:DnaJ domain-containing protein [Thecamonas trahens ATCC 50062]|uniref:DnaJ domain-containing protein n=1 Tax=Thecamonas trahens ATCC 50062 TaxID=461836 RepID=A0A0L0DF27_THETB|nr:DnaJ domain-containing protein [Thecamonas trahens ATCC 50062]KNC50746.1 DnaJ domain-containing protein [Thecamonas trahens ATCC 50062]|eukprot:XP_013756711.1 DnaJ domain-containing protein [Thecamonas trahens ATCC 50062]
MRLGLAFAVVVLLAVVAVEVAEAGKDYYKILGIPRDSPERVIKKAFRAAARKHHPDRSKLPKENAEEKFREISKAYEVLSDPELREVYDRHGEEGIDRMNNGGSPGGGGGGGGGGFNFEFGGGGFNFGDMFGGGFGGGGGGGGMRKQEATVELSLREIYKGGDKKVYVNTGSGQKVVILDVPAGIREGESIESPDGRIVFNVKEKKHPRFERAGAHLHTSVPITLHDALLGTTVTLRHIDGSDLEFTIPPGKVVSPKSKKTFKKKGFPIVGSRSGRRGNLIVTFDIEFPAADSMTDADRALFASSFGDWVYGSKGKGK